MSPEVPRRRGCSRIPSSGNLESWNGCPFNPLVTDAAQLERYNLVPDRPDPLIAHSAVVHEHACEGQGTERLMRPSPKPPEW